MLLNVIFDEIVLFLGPLPLLQAPFHWTEFSCLQQGLKNSNERHEDLTCINTTVVMYDEIPNV
jgi:hypothetical protein